MSLGKFVNMTLDYMSVDKMDQKLAVGEMSLGKLGNMDNTAVD
jgi:hypothetical protein